MNRSIKILSVLSVVIALSACSKKKNEDEDGMLDGEDVPYAEDAGTDALPDEIGELEQYSADESYAEEDGEEAESEDGESDPYANYSSEEYDYGDSTNTEGMDSGMYEDTAASEVDEAMEAGAEEVAGAVPEEPGVTEPASDYSFNDTTDTTSSFADTPTETPSDSSGSASGYTGSGSGYSAPASGSGDFENYVIQKGDTLMKIAFEFYGNVTQWRKIWQSNQGVLSDPNMIRAGKTIRVERPSVPPTISRNGDPYQIKNGDTLASISRDVYGTPRKWKRIQGNNPELIRNPNNIYAGFYLYYTMTPQDQMDRQQYEQKSPVAGDSETFGRQPTGQ